MRVLTCWVCWWCVLMKRIVSFSCVGFHVFAACPFDWLCFLWPCHAYRWMLMCVVTEHADCLMKRCVWMFECEPFDCRARQDLWLWIFWVYFKLIHFPPYFHDISFILFTLKNSQKIEKWSNWTLIFFPSFVWMSITFWYYFHELLMSGVLFWNFWTHVVLNWYVAFNALWNFLCWAN